jgi:hypothetical protein
MHDPRIPTALRQLTDLGRDDLPSRWSWAIVGRERIGRIRLPAPAIAALDVGAGGEVRMRSNRLAVIVRPDGPGAAGTVDGRGRLFVPVWLRQAGSRALLVGTWADRSLVVVAPVALGVELEDLIAAHTGTAVVVPTLAEHVEAIAPTFGAGTAGTYRSYWRLAVDLLGDRRLTEITIVDLQAVVAVAASRARQRREGSTGRSSTENCVAALRALFGRAHAAGLISANPAAALTKPRRARSRRRALDDAEIAELIDAIRTTSDDPDIDPRRSTAWLREKNSNEREQPHSPTLTRLLIGHATDCGARHPDHPVFRRRSGTPVTARNGADR